jgi:hypothetical protein
MPGLILFPSPGKYLDFIETYACTQARAAAGKEDGFSDKAAERKSFMPSE